MTTRAASAPEALAAALPSARSRGRLRLEGVTKRFVGTNIPAIENIGLDLAPGEFVVVVGPSGCGKSTLLQLAAGMLKPDAGRVSLDDWTVKGPGPDRAMVFQEHALFPWYTAEQNVALGLRIAGVPASEVRDRVHAALSMVRLQSAGHKLIHQLSGGMRQRVAIARALVLDPAALLMDEPFAALDAQTRTVLHEQVQDLWQKTRKTILFVTHSVGEAARLADRIVVLRAHPGRIRREFRVDIPHPRDFDSPALSELVGEIRDEIQDEAARMHAEDGDGA